MKRRQGDWMSLRECSCAWPCRRQERHRARIQEPWDSAEMGGARSSVRVRCGGRVWGWCTCQGLALAQSSRGKGAGEHGGARSPLTGLDLTLSVPVQTLGAEALGREGEGRGGLPGDAGALSQVKTLALGPAGGGVRTGEQVGPRRNPL